MQNENEKKIKILLKVMFIYEALLQGWSVTKSKKINNAFEFTINAFDYNNSPCRGNYTIRKRSISEPIRYIN